MNWIKSRIIEPTTWVSVGVGALILSILVPQAAPILLLAAGVTVAAGILMKEKGS